MQGILSLSSVFITFRIYDCKQRASLGLRSDKGTLKRVKRARFSKREVMNFIQIVRSFDVPVNSAASLGSISRHSGTHRAQRVRERGEKERGGSEEGPPTGREERRRRRGRRRRHREDTREAGHCTGERVRTLGRGSRPPSARSSWGFCAISRSKFDSPPGELAMAAGKSGVGI